MEKNKTGKYLKYAIGEIILVVIGILIALSINNWNEQNKNKLVEIKILSELKNDLKFNYQEISGIRNETKLNLNRTDSLIEAMNNKSFDIDSHSNLLIGLNGGTNGLFNNSNTTYKFIENNGFKILSNDSLRLSISNMYTKRFSNISTREKAFRKLFDDTIWPYISTNFHLSKNTPSISTGLKPLSDVKFMNMLSMKATLLRASVNNTLGCLKELEILIQELENEITMLKG